MNRTKTLDAARQAITVDRAATHGRAEDTFGLIAAYWSAHLDAHITETDVAVMMVLLKLARAKGNPANADNWVDAVGYSALGGELASIADECPECGRAALCTASGCLHPLAMRGRVE